MSLAPGARSLLGVILSAACLFSEAKDVTGVYRADAVQHFDIQYLLTLPAGYAEGQQAWPLIVFLHGGSGRGTDINLVKQYGPALRAASDPNFAFIVLSPQCPKGEIWTDADALIALIDDVSTHYRVDRKREYLTGLSMGGRGTWYIAYRYPHQFAAIAPLAAFQTITDGWPQALRDVPSWAFHGARDSIAPLQDDQKMVDLIQKEGGDAKLTILPNRGHDITSIYDQPDIYAWFLTHRKP